MQTQKPSRVLGSGESQQVEAPLWSLPYNVHLFAFLTYFCFYKQSTLIHEENASRAALNSSLKLILASCHETTRELNSVW